MNLAERLKSTFTSSASSLLKSNIVAGVEIDLTGDSMRMNLIVLKKKKSLVIRESEKEGIKDFKEISQHITKDTPVCISIIGKGIIHKKIYVSSEDDHAALIQKILPNANEKEFYIRVGSSVTAEKENMFVSIIRKTIVDDLLKEASQEGLNIISCTLGAFDIVPMIPLLKDFSSDFTIVLSNQSLYIKNDIIENYSVVESSLPQPLTVGGQKIAPALGLAFVTGFNYFISETRFHFIDTVKNSFHEFRQKLLFTVLKWGTLSFFLLTLMGNYLLFDHFWNKEELLRSKMQINQSELEHLDNLKKEYSDKKSFLEQTGFIEKVFLSYYSDQIALDLPEKIRFERMEVFPLIKNNDEQKLSFSKKKISINGFCQKSIELNDWIRQLKKKTWIKDVVLVKYEQEKSKSVGEFKIEITMS